MALSHIEECCQDLATESRELYLDHAVPVLNGPPTALEFLRSWINANKPVVIRGAVDHWSALKKWNHEYLRSTLQGTEVTVSVTPNGYADAVDDGKFVMAEDRMLSFPQFLDILEGQTDDHGIFYVQKQNSNFTEEFDELMADAESHLSWATEAMGCMPDAVNFWMGDKRAVSSMHKDNYENLYCVVKGWKKFTLIPPTDQPFVPYEEYPVAKYHEREPGIWETIPDKDGATVPWIAIDPLRPDFKKYPRYRHAQPITVTVHAGETLYLPSLWYHHVEQSHGCIAVNFWYDMQYDIKYSYYKFVEQLIKNAKS